MKKVNASVYIYRGNPRKAAFVYLFSKILGKEWVYNVADDHNTYEDVFEMNYLTRWLFINGLENSRAVISQSSLQQNNLLINYGVNSTVVPNGYPKAESTVTFGDREYFLWVGRLEQDQKRPHLFLDLADNLPQGKFVLAGPTSDDTYSEEIIRRADTIDNVNYIGYVGPHSIYDYYKDSIALVNTSKFEGFPNTFLEAWRCGTPVISLSVDPNRFMKTRFDCFANSSMKKLTEICHNIANKTELRKSFGEEVLDQFNQQFSMSEVGELYKNAIKE